ncbi:transposase [uncultured Cellulomonas sp.]|uniref:transposase n=1 Tax=uncultured Cellulomonas sp. TaxID=189682 RepID=UPI0028E2EA07|nr:transposase [uncultured Cellulomonas sp.]
MGRPVWSTCSQRASHLGQLVAGQRDGAVMADLAKSKLRRKIPDLIEALTGRFDEHHALIVGQLLTRVNHVEQGLADLDAQIAIDVAPWQHEVDLLRTIPGVGPVVAHTVPHPGAPCRPAGVAPGMHESAGKRTPTGARHGNRFLTSMLVEAAGSASRTKTTYLAGQYRRIAARRGSARAAVAVAHSILTSAYWMPVRDEPYRDLGAEWLLDPRRTTDRTRRLVHQLEDLGHTVTLDKTS